METEQPKTYTVYINGEIVDTEARRGDVDIYMELHTDVPVAAVENVKREGGQA